MSADTIDAKSPKSRFRLRAVLDVLLVFAVFAADGAWPVPDVNEAHYLAKAKHYWEPEWAGRDLFLASADSHVPFFATLGWLTHVLPLPAAAWIGRLIEWGLLAWGWRRLSFAIVPRFGWAALTAAAAVALGERLHMAGEWVVGGCEAKGIAYALVFSALADLIGGRWNRALVQLGGATAFHVLAGGWSIVCAGVVWLAAGRNRPRLADWLPGLLVAVVLSLPGLVPALALSRGVEAATVAEANRIYVYERLAHHLDPQVLVPEFGLRHAALWASLLAACVLIPADQGRRTLRWFVLGAGLLALVGLAIGYLMPPEDPRTAALLRFYWFRLSDVMPAIGVALELAALAHSSRSPLYRSAVVIVLALIAAAHLVASVNERGALPFARAENLGNAADLRDWRDVCQWIQGNTPAEALFLTPRSFGTFKWYAGRAEVAVWKDVPQDAASLVEWRRRLRELSGNDGVGWLNHVPVEHLRGFAERHDVDYLVTYREPRLALPAVYSNNRFSVYSFRPEVPAGR